MQNTHVIVRNVARSLLIVSQSCQCTKQCECETKRDRDTIIKCNWDETQKCTRRLVFVVNVNVANLQFDCERIWAQLMAIGNIWEQLAPHGRVS